MEAVLVSVSVEVLPGVAGLGLKLPAAPAGSPLMLRVTAALKPLTLPTFTVKVVVPPWLMAWLAGDALNEKSGGGGAVTTNVALVVWLKLPLVPVMVSA